MAFITLQIGQCGNQLGHTFFKTVDEIASSKSAKNPDYACEIRSRFFEETEFDGKHLANAILLDTEEKVIKTNLNSIKCASWDYKRSLIKMVEKGAGNNWAMGHNYHGPNFHEFILDSIRKELEHKDQMQGFLIFGSTAGGSGSGLGSYASEIIRDEYAHASLLSISVWPFQKGDVAVQSYNSLLNLASMQNVSDGIIMLENDWLLKLCCQKRKIKNPSIWDLNLAASEQLVNLLLPISSDFGVNLSLNDMLGFLVPHPQFKLIELRSVPQEPLASLPFCSYNWPALMRSLRRMLLYSTAIDEVYGKNNISSNHITSPPLSLANLLLLRGRESETADLNSLQKPPLPYASWVPTSSRIKMLTDKNSVLGYDRTALLANNSQLPVSCLDQASATAWKLFSSKFFFHHYENYGLSADTFYSTILAIEQIISSYKSLSL